MRVVVPDLAKALLAYEFRDFRWFLRSGMNLRGDNVEQLLVNWVASYAMRQPENGPVSYDGGPPINPEEVKEFIADMDSMEGFVEWCVTRIPSDSPYIAHVNGFYPEKLLKWFKDAGFRQVVFSNYRCSIMPELKEEGFDNHASASLFMEAIK
ncbi:hypothetical protein N9L49_02270 [Rhodospirillales bacterium]|nr:hypothetical protein [Rhodospirillales bacterium]